MNIEDSNIKDICGQIADVYKKKMQKADYDPSGELMNFTWNVEMNGALFQLYFNLPDYWQYAEYGRGPGKFPPIEAILKWIQYKRLTPSSSGKAISSHQLAYVIARKIAREGTKGKPLLLETINETYNTLVDLLVDAITNLLEKDLEKDLELV